MQQLNHIDDFIAFQAGSHIIKLTWTNYGVYNVTVHDGIRVLDDQGGPFPTEAEARLVARGYAQMYLAEHQAKLAEACADPRTIAAEPRIARLQAQMPGPGAEQALIDDINTTIDRAQPDTIDVSDILADIETASRNRVEQAIRRADLARRDFTRTRVHCQPLTPAELDLIRSHRDGRVTTKRGQSWTVLRAIVRRGYGEPVYGKGTRIIAVRLNGRGLNAAQISEEEAA